MPQQAELPAARRVEVGGRGVPPCHTISAARCVCSAARCVCSADRTFSAVRRKTWTEATEWGDAWGCSPGDASCGRFDFGIAVKDGAIFTVGGDEETAAPKEDNSVWRVLPSSV